MKIGIYKTTVHLANYVDKRYVPGGKPSKYYPSKCYVKLHAIYPDNENEPWFVFDEWLSLNKIIDKEEGDIFTILLPPSTRKIIDGVKLINEQALYMISIRYNANFLKWVVEDFFPANREEVTCELTRIIEN